MQRSIQEINLVTNESSFKTLLTLIRFGIPECSLLKVPELAHPFQIDIKKLDSVWPPHDEPYFVYTFSNSEVCNLRRCQTSPYDEYIDCLPSAQLRCNRRGWERSDLRAVALSFAFQAIEIGLAGSYCKHDCPSIMRSFVRDDLERLCSISAVPEVGVLYIF